MKNPNGPAGNPRDTGFTYTVRPETVEGCECEDCKAGRHIYSLFCWENNTWRWAATSLMSYQSAEEAKEKHWWGIDFGPGAVWEDGVPVVLPEPTTRRPEGDSAAVEWVPLDMDALNKSAELLTKHWMQRE